MNDCFNDDWFKKLVSTCRNAIAEAGKLVEEPVCRMTLNAIVKDSNIHSQPESISGKVLVENLAKRLTLVQLRDENCSASAAILRCLPPLRMIQEALFTPDLHECVKSGQPNHVIADTRISLEKFLRVLNEQVTIIRDNH